jgi:hypothetical protein
MRSTVLIGKLSVPPGISIRTTPPSTAAITPRKTRPFLR